MRCIAASCRGTIGYFADTGKNVLFRVGLDAATGLPRGAPVALVTRRGGGGIDGAVVDADGLIWNARWGGGCIDVYSPQGEHLRSLHVPARQSSCPAFVGPDFSRLLVTSAWQGMAEDAKHADPGHGRTFVLDVAARGRPRTGCEASNRLMEEDEARQPNARERRSFKSRIQRSDDPGTIDPR
jgi:sugar lactone lactonase